MKDLFLLEKASSDYIDIVRDIGPIYKELHTTDDASLVDECGEFRYVDITAEVEHYKEHGELGAKHRLSLESLYVLYFSIAHFEE